MTRGLYVPLQANFFADDRIVRCSRMAQLVYLQGLTIAKQCGTDGVVTYAQLERECGDILDLQKCVNELRKLKLWRLKSGRNTTVTFEIGRWLTHNRSQEWIEAQRLARAEDGKRGGRPPKPPKSERVTLSEVKRVTLSENGKGQKGTENLDRREVKRSTARAHELTTLAFEQPIKPALRAGGKGAFPAVLGIIDKLLEAGHPDNTIEAAIRSGVEVWTTAGLTTAIAKAKRTTPTLTYADAEVSYA